MTFACTLVNVHHLKGIKVWKGQFHMLFVTIQGWGAKIKKANLNLKRTSARHPSPHLEDTTCGSPRSVPQQMSLLPIGHSLTRWTPAGPPFPPRAGSGPDARTRGRTRRVPFPPRGSAGTGSTGSGGHAPAGGHPPAPSRAPHRGRRRTEPAPKGRHRVTHPQMSCRVTSPDTAAVACPTAPSSSGQFMN